MKISKMLLWLLMALLPMNALAVTEGVVEQAPDVDLSTYTEWTVQSTKVYLPDIAMYADRVMTAVPDFSTVVPRPTLIPLPTDDGNGIARPTMTPTPMPTETGNGTEDREPVNWSQVQPTPMPAPADLTFILQDGTLFTEGEENRIRHIQAERAAGIVRHASVSDRIVLVSFSGFPTAVMASGEVKAAYAEDGTWFLYLADGNGAQIKSTENGILALPGDMALFLVDPADYDGETWYLMLPARELTEMELLAVFDVFDLLGQSFDPGSVNIRNCCRGLSYNRALRPEEAERSGRLSQLVYSDLIPGNIKTDGNRNLVLCCGTDPMFFLRPYSSMTDEELLMEINVNNQDVMDRITEREAREMLNRYFGFPLSMACVSYLHGYDTLVVEGIRKEDQQIMMKHADSIMGAEFEVSEDADSLIFVDVCFDDVLEGRMIYVKYVNIPKTENEYDAASVYRMDTMEKYPELCAAADRFAERYFGKNGLHGWCQASDDPPILPHTVLPAKPYMILYTYTDEILLSMTVEEDGLVREANMHFFNGSADLMRKMEEYPEKYVRLGDVLAELDM